MNSLDHSILSVPRLPAAAIAICAGLLGTVTQIIWLRILIQWYGATTTTVAATLAVSLAGLSLGAFLFRNAGAKLFGRDSSPLRSAGWLVVFASASVLEGLSAYAFADYNPVNLSHLLGQPTDLLVTTVAVLLPANLALGGILPALVCSRNHQSAARLYAAETLGGAVGCLATGLWLVYALGLTGSLLVVGILGLLIGGIAAARNSAVQAVKVASTVEPTVADDVVVEHVSQWPLLAAIFLAGVASIGMEVVWQRLLILVVGTDNYSYTIVVTSYLLGVCLGSQAYAWLAGRQRGRTTTVSLPNRSATFAWLQLGVAITSITVLILFCQLASGVGQQWLVSFQAIDSPLTKRFILCFGLLMLPTALVGASFPAAVAALAAQNKRANQATARVYAIGSIGNVVGVILCGFVLVPTLGLQLSAIALCGIAIAAGFTWLLACQTRGTQKITWLSATAFGIAATAVGFRPQPIGLSEETDNHRIIFYREGPVNTVGVIEESIAETTRRTIDRPTEREQTFRSLSVDGIVIGESDGGVDEKQRLLAHLPLIVDAMANPAGAEDRLSILTIGLGTGILAGEAATQSKVKRLTCVELSPAVISAAKLFHASNRDVLENPKATILQSDGIHFLRQSTDNYDAIISDGKSQPGHAGNIAFFSADYYRIANAHLTPTGAFVQWLPLAAPPAETRIILKTFAQQFPYGYVAVAVPDSIYLVGRQQPLRWSATDALKHLDRSPALHRYGWRTNDDLLSMGWLDAKSVAAEFLVNVPANTSDRPILERFASASLRLSDKKNTQKNLHFLHQAIRLAEIPLSADTDSVGDNVSNKSNLRAACLALVDAAIGEVAGEADWIGVASKDFQRAFRTLPNLTRGIRLSDKILSMMRAGDADRVPELNSIALGQAARFAPNDVKIQAAIGQALMAATAYDQAASCLYRATKLEPQDADHHVAFAHCLIQLGKPAAAIRSLRTAVRLDPAHLRGHQQLAVAAHSIGDERTVSKHREISKRLEAALANPTLTP